MLALDTVILFPLVIFFVMNYRIGPGETPYWLFGLIFLMLFTNIILDLKLLKLINKKYNLIKKIILWGLIFLTIGSGLFSEITVRHQSSPIYHVHDIILQQEAAIRFMIHGINPYTTSYFNTPMAQWHYSDTEVNPALYHFVMQPFYLIFTVPFYFVMTRTLGFFDARVPLFFLFIVMLFVSEKIVKSELDKRLSVALLAFNPATLGYFIEGRDDIFMFSFMVVGFFFMLRNKNIFASIFMALAFAVKQSAWPLFPFYVFYLYFKERKLVKLTKPLTIFALTFLLIVAPFFLWSPKGFIDSTIFFVSGNATHSYPVAGYGLGMLLHQIGIIPNVHAYFPFWIFEVIVSVPILIWLLFWLKKSISIKKVILGYGIFLFVFWYCSRYFNNSHLGYLTMIFIFAYFMQEESESKNKPNI